MIKKIIICLFAILCLTGCGFNEKQNLDDANNESNVSNENDTINNTNQTEEYEYIKKIGLTRDDIKTSEIASITVTQENDMGVWYEVKPYSYSVETFNAWGEKIYNKCKEYSTEKKVYDYLGKYGSEILNWQYQNSLNVYVEYEYYINEQTVSVQLFGENDKKDGFKFHISAI